MKLKGIRMEDFTNYKKPSMFLIFPTCNWKCERECGEHCCQNSALAQSPIIDISTKQVCEKYMCNPITHSVVCGGLEPMDSFDDLWMFIYRLRVSFNCKDDIVVYTGHTKEECIANGWIQPLREFDNIIIKFGRFIPNQQPHYDEVLGVTLASDNQYAERIS